jgi:hypothetical protein
LRERYIPAVLAKAKEAEKLEEVSGWYDQTFLHLTASLRVGVKKTVLYLLYSL